MAAQPWFPFYPGDWLNDAQLGECTMAQQGAWMRVLSHMHLSAERGLLRMPLAAIARKAQCRVSDLHALAANNVLRGSDDAISAAVLFRPVHARQRGAAVVLVDAQPGPLWYSYRMLKDEYKRRARYGSYGSAPIGGDAPNPQDGDSPTTAPNPQDGDSPNPGNGASPNPSPITRESQISDKYQYIILTDDGDRSADRSPPLVNGSASPTVNGKAEHGPPPIPRCDHEAVLAAWREFMPTNPQPVRWTESRRRHLQARWRELFAEGKAHNRDEAIAWFARLFRYARKSAFLTGQVTPRQHDRLPFMAELGWLMQPENFTACIEGRYHQSR